MRLSPAVSKVPSFFQGCKNTRVLVLLWLFLYIYCLPLLEDRGAK